MVTVLTVFHVFVCLFLVLAILLQAGRGGGMGLAFGGMSQQMFGGGGAAPFLAKITSATAIAFFLTSASLAYISGQQEDLGLQKRSETLQNEKKKAKEELEKKRLEEEKKAEAAQAAAAAQAQPQVPSAEGVAPGAEPVIPTVPSPPPVNPAENAPSPPAPK